MDQNQQPYSYQQILNQNYHAYPSNSFPVLTVGHWVGTLLLLMIPFVN